MRCWPGSPKSTSSSTPWKTRKSDSLDFHDVSVWGVKEALIAAYQAGLAAGQKAA